MCVSDTLCPASGWGWKYEKSVLSGSVSTGPWLAQAVYSSSAVRPIVQAETLS